MMGPATSVNIVRPFTQEIEHLRKGQHHQKIIVGAVGVADTKESSYVPVGHIQSGGFMIYEHYEITKQFEILNLSIMNVMLSLSYHFQEADNMLIRDCDYRWDTKEGLSIKWNGQWNKIEVPGYTPVELLGAGANGVTYKAFHQVTDRYEVIKVWMPTGKNYKKRFLNEVQKVAKLRNNAIMMVYDGKVLSNGFCIAAYEYIPGKSLKKWLDTDPSIQDRLNVCREILQAVHDYQSKGVLHGDLHDENIIISEELHPTLIDFGISAFSQEGQTNDRELYFIATLVSSLLKPCKAYNKKHFAFCAKRNPKPHIEPIPGALTTFSFEPILMTETMQQYTELMELMEYVPEFGHRDIATYAGFASKSFYLDIKQLMDDTVNRYIEENLNQEFVSVMDENIYYEAFPECCDENDLFERLLMSSLMAYCVMARLVHPPLINSAKEDLPYPEGTERARKITLHNEVIDALNTWLADVNAQEFFEVTQELQAATGESGYELYETARETLFQSLDKHFCDEKIRFSYWLCAKMREIQWKAEYPQKLENAIRFAE